ncbi:tail fiber protein [Francisella philomiragia]|uniref:Tail fiber protein n=1 Tax=Francisella philomiragia TaxID=28110 RepID=A0ABS1GD13_9GAMM|nr:tail fiber protein [Francisella philomiragia]MBK2258994.1 tail fiber protein [Francisella philomiragia]MBK2302685.1 tail fiber protein [Francisella philomiragia]
MSNTLTIPNSMLDKLANANINGDSIVISDYSVTDSSVNDEATVGNIIHSDSITATQDDPNNINTIIVKVVIPSSVNSNNTVRKIYLYDQDGDVFGYGLVPPFTLSANNNIEAELNFYITNSNISTVTITTASMTYVTQDMLADALANKLDITEALHLVPVGSMISIPADVPPPEGFLAAEGGAVSRAVFSNLFAVYGTTYGEGDGLTTFGLIDMRGNFTRGLGGNSDAIGVLQADELKSHRHTSWIYQGSILNLQYAGSPNTYTMVGGNTGYTGGLETRPVNYAVKYFIKY